MAHIKTAHIGGKHAIDMTEGNIVISLIRFTLPLLVGNLFQQLYNLVDTWVIGQSGNDAAYAAVGSVGPVINILIGFFLGLSSGAGVIISQYFGAKDEEKVKKTVHTSIALTLVMAVITTVLGVVMTPTILRLMLHTDGSDNEVFREAKTYLIIYFSGVIGLMIYNMGAGILRAVGDSKHPFYFLLASAITNTLLDLLFVFKMNMGVEGVAIATVIAQTISAILTLITLLKTSSCVKLVIREIKFTKEYLKQITKVGFPAAIQMAITSFSNVFVQSYISGVNIPGGVSEGLEIQTVAMSAWTTYSKIDQFLFLPIQSMGLAVTTFVGQNLGINDTKRAKKGTYIGFCMALTATVVLMIPVMIFAPFWAKIFNKTPDVIANAALLLQYITPFYVCCCVNQVFAAALRGAGNTRTPMVTMLVCFVGFRQLYLFVMSSFISNNIIPIGMSYPAGWLACATTLLIYFSRFDMSKTRIVKDEPKKNERS